MLTLDEILALLARDDLSDDERSNLNEALANLGELTDDELTQLDEALLARADQILDAVNLDGAEGDDRPAPTEEQIETLTWLADAHTAVAEVQDSRDEADDDARERAAAIRDRLRGGTDGDDGEPAAAGDGDDAGTEGDEPAGDDAAAEPEAVAASGGVSRVNARRPRAARPRRTSATGQPVGLVAAAGVPDVASGADLRDPERLGLAFANTLQHMSGMSLRAGMKVPVATARIEFPEDAMLSADSVRRNERLLQQYADPEAQTRAIIASGELQAPPVPRYDFPELGVATRPVRDALPRFGSERGGSIIPAPLVLDDLDGAASLWTTVQNESAAQNPKVRKPCLRMSVGTDTTVVPYAIVQCLEIDNWNARTWPERVQRFVSLAEKWRVRFAESRLLTRIGSLSTQVACPQTLGTAVDVLTNLDLAAAAMRNADRMDPMTPLRWMAPATLRDEIRADYARRMPGTTDEALALADATIDQWFSVRNIVPTWFLDGEAGQVFPVQTDGTLRGWHPTVISYLFPEGTFVYLDGGELNLGVVRDTTVNSTNDFQMFDENWEEVAKVGPRSYRLAMTLLPDGSSAGTLEPAATVATS